MLKVVIRNVIYTILFPIVLLFFGLVMSFFLTRLLPGDPILAHLAAVGIYNPTPGVYIAMAQTLGFDQPLDVQFFRYISELFSGNLGISVTIAPNNPIIELLTDRILLSTEFTIMPIVLGLIAGILLGMLSVKVRYKLVKVFIQILIILGISMPMFFVGMWSQYILGYQLGLFPMVGDPFLPSCILFVLTLFLTTRQVRSNYLKRSEEKHILSNSLQLVFNLSVLCAGILLLEVIFGLPGFFSLFLNTIYLNDYYVARVCLFILIVLPAIVLFLSNIVYTSYNYFLEENQVKMFTKYFGRDEKMVEEGARYALVTEQRNKDFIFFRLKSPLTIIGLATVVISIVVAVFPQILTPFTLEQATGVYAGMFDPPSATHPLGKTHMGRDVLAILAYGVSTTMKVCILPVIIGIVIGALFGYLSKVHKLLKGVVLAFMVVLFIIPSVIMISIFSHIYGGNISEIIGIMTMYMIPWVTLIISKGNYSLKLTAKKIITYFPLFMGFNILLYEAIGFIQFSDPSLVQLGTYISYARFNLSTAPWASLWPGLALYLLVIGFFTLHYGLKEPIPIVRRS